MNQLQLFKNNAKDSLNSTDKYNVRAVNMDYFKLDRKDKLIKSICESIGYNGRKIRASLGSVPNQLDSYWDCGSKDTYYFYHLDQQKLFKVDSNHPFFEVGKPRQLNQLPNRILLIEHSIFCGKDLGLKIYSNVSDRGSFLPPVTEKNN